MIFRRMFLVLGLMGMVGFGVSGCNDHDKKTVTEDASRLAKSGGEALGNATLAGKVNGVLSVWKGIDMSGWSVQAENGVVTVEGEVRNTAERRRIISVLNNIRGIDKIVADKLKAKDGK